MALFVAALAAAANQVYAVNPMSTSRYRDRHVTSRAKSDPGDAKVLADMVRTDRHNHRVVAADSQQVQAVKILSLAQSMVWTRGRQTNQLRPTLREFYPAALEAFADLDHPDAVEVLRIAPTPEQGAVVSKVRIVAALRRGGQQRRIEQRAVEIQCSPRSEQLAAPAIISAAMGASVAACLAVIATMNTQIEALAGELATGFEQHPDAVVVRSLPGLGTILGARVPASSVTNRTAMPTSSLARTKQACHPSPEHPAPDVSCWPVTSATAAWPTRFYLWAFAALNTSPGARKFYDAHRAAGDTHHMALRALGNRLVGILHGCLARHTQYDEAIAWAHRSDQPQQQAA